MTITRWLTAVVMVAGMATGSAIPARADYQPMQGIYAYTQPGGAPYTWTISPTCVPVVGDLRVPLYLAVGCTLHVSGSAEHAGLESPQAPFGGIARLTNDRWTFQLPKPDGLTCPDGSTAPTLETYAFDEATLTGTITVVHDAACGMQPALTKAPFTLTLVGPLPVPVEPYPLQCEPGGVRLCI
jgi:hypothetical protein